MNLPHPGDYIDIHVHDGRSEEGVFILETLMAHETRVPYDMPGAAFTYGIHPWFLTEENSLTQLRLVEEITSRKDVVAIGEAGFDKLRGPSMDLQAKIFMDQVSISERLQKPLIIHCVRAWDEVLDAAKKTKPQMYWMIHGYRGRIEHAMQLLSKGFWLSVWFDFALRSESSELLQQLPADRFFLETDGADVDIRTIYQKVASDRGTDVEELKALMYSNYMKFFRIP